MLSGNPENFRPNHLSSVVYVEHWASSQPQLCSISLIFGNTLNLFGPSNLYLQRKKKSRTDDLTRPLSLQTFLFEINLLNNTLNTVREASSLLKLEVNISRSKNIETFVYFQRYVKPYLTYSFIKAYFEMKLKANLNIQSLLLN